MSESDIEYSLSNAAHNLRRPGDRRVSVLGAAHSLGIEVFVTLHDSPDRSQARIELKRRPPRISVFRTGEIRGDKKLGLGDEWMLTPRERFSVAHEIGHWIASTQLRLREPSGSREYWLQEQWMNSFAGALLVPDWLLGGWLAQIPETGPVSPVSLWRWATRELKVSEEVLASAIARVRSSAAFVKLVRCTRRSDNASVFKVMFSATNGTLRVPARGTHIADADLHETLASGPIGRRISKSWIIGKCPPQDVTLAWRCSARTGDYHSNPLVCWLSLARLEKCESDEDNPLFNGSGLEIIDFRS